MSIHYDKEFTMLTARRAAAAIGGTLIALFTAACTSHPAATRGASAPDPGPPPASPTPTASATPAAIGGITGTLYYVDHYPDRDQVLRSTPAGVTRVLPAGGHSANVSPDGRRIAYITDGADLVVTDGAGAQPRTVMHGVADPGYEPAWSPDGTRLLVTRQDPKGPGGQPGIVDVATGRFTVLAHDPRGIHYLWSADGQHLGYSTGVCQLGLADPDGGNAHLVPVLGSQDPKLNPDQRRTCDPYSISPDGTRMAVDLHTGDMPDGDIGRGLHANAVIDTRTGTSVRLPVTGTVTAVLFQRDGGMLVRTRTGESTALVRLSAAGTVVGRATETPATKDIELLAYVPA
jgi:TolB protein